MSIMGSSHIRQTVRRWADEWGIRFEYIQPGKPQQNAYVERFNRTVRYEWLSQYHWRDLDEVQLYATNWMWMYNHERPNMALGGITPKQRLAMTAGISESTSQPDAFRGDYPCMIRRT